MSRSIILRCLVNALWLSVDADLMQSIPAKFVVRTEPPPRILPHWVPLGSGHLLGIQLRDAQRGFQASVNLLQEECRKCAYLALDIGL
jgi:hypothetical protein